MLQIVLKNYGYYQSKVDGQFGPASKLALKNFQTENGLISDGIIGKNTCNTLLDKKNVIMKNSNKVFEKKGIAGKIFADHAKDNGLIVRAIGDIIAFCPPLIITDSQINDMFDIVEESLKKTMDEMTKQGLLK